MASITIRIARPSPMRYLGYMPRTRPPYQPILVRMDCDLLSRIDRYRADQLGARGAIVDRVTAIHELIEHGLRRKARKKSKQS